MGFWFSGPGGSAIVAPPRAGSLQVYEPLANCPGALSASSDWSMKAEAMYWWIIRYDGSSGHSCDAYGPMPQLPLYRKLPAAAPDGAVSASRMIALSGRFLPQS